MSKFRYFKCNVLGGFRLSDLNLNIKQGEFFLVDAHEAETSRAVISALRDRWMIEVTEKEASVHITIPKDVANTANIAKGGVQDSNIGTKAAKNQSSGLSIPNVKDVNRNLESRQAENSKIANSKAAIPNFRKAEEDIKKRQADTMNKVGASSDQELLAGMKDTEVAVGPDFAKQGKVEDVNSTVVVKQDETIKILANDSTFDNSLVATPNFDEKKEEAKQEVKVEIEKKIRRKRKKPTEAQETTTTEAQVATN